MSNVFQFRDREDPTAEACEWLARIDRGLTEQEEQELRAWYAGHPRRASALIESARLWDKMGSLSRLADLFPKPVPRRAANTRVRLALAASLLLAAVAALIPIRQRVFEPPAQVPEVAASYRQLFETAIGEHSTVRLPDGSELTLNTHSRVSAVFRERERRLTLERGEVYVKVAHDAARPFRVHAGHRVVRAVGTQFNVELEADQRVEVIVTEGKVLVEFDGGDATGSTAAAAGAHDIPLVAGERAWLGQEAQVVQPIDADEMDARLSWREGNLIFRGQPLSEALSEIERYAAVDFVIADENLKSIRVAGVFKAGDVDGLLETLQQNFDISHERQGTEKIVLKGR